MCIYVCVLISQPIADTLHTIPPRAKKELILQTEYESIEKINDVERNRVRKKTDFLVCIMFPFHFHFISAVIRLDTCTDENENKSSCCSYIDNINIGSAIK